MRGYRIDLIRHGKTQANDDGRFIGSTDLPLSDDGVSGLYKLLEERDYPYAEKVYCSTLLRAKQTAAILYPNTDAEYMDELKEASLGDFENKTLDELMQREDFRKYLENAMKNPPPNGENPQEIIMRCLTALNSIIGEMMREGLTHTAVITHGGIIQSMAASFGMPKLKAGQLSLDFGEGIEVIVTADMWQRSGCFEIAGRIPLEKISEEDDY